MTVQTGWVSVATVNDVRPGTVEVFDVDGKALCVGQTADGRWGAIDDLCTHDGGDLGEGELVGDAVECPRHGSVFDLFTGEALTLPAVYPVKAYPTRVEGNSVEVQL
ncbi:MAG: non-heme iron oxygenase ferredoxin subunit [Chloroflexota bacterium]|nr:non-heme iron oxygenase ferredoxin subunit [Chloroflexota bacterium]